MRTPLSRVRHYGAAHDGTGHFWLERVSAAANLVLAIVFIIVMVGLAGRSYDTVIAVIGSPIVAALLVMFIAAAAIHMRIGMEAIIVDYVSGEASRMIWLVANTFFSIAVAVIAILATLKIALGG